MLQHTLRPLTVNPFTGAVARSVGQRLSREVEAFIFVASTGRSGTNTLQQLFDAVPGCAAFHEPPPIMHREVMSSYNDGDTSVMHRTFLNAKLPKVYLAARGCRWYVETSHVFIKCFAEVAAQSLGPRLRVVHLVRDPDAVAASFVHRRLVFTQGDARVRNYGWTLHPDAPRNLVRPWDDAAVRRRFDHLYFEYLWMWYETEARTHVFERNHPEVPIYHIRTEQLNDPQAVGELLRWANMPMGEAVRHRVGTRVNLSPGGRPRPLPSDVRRKDVAAFHEICRELLEQVAPIEARPQRRVV